MRSFHIIALCIGPALLSAPGGAQQPEALGSAGPAQRSPTQRDVARMLTSTNPDKRDDALRMAQMVRPEYVSRELRLGLFVALGKEAASHQVQLRSRPAQSNAGNGRSVTRYYGGLIARVASLKDSTMIPMLANSLGTGMTPVRALVEFGRTASISVLRVTNNSGSANEQIADGLLTLRLMLENPGTRPLTPAGRSNVRNATLARLNAPQSRDVMLRAIEVAIVLGDRDLREIVAGIASSDDQVRRRGITDRADINKVKRHAHDRLRGLPAMPRA